MARTLIATNAVPRHGVSLDAATMTAADDSNDMYFVNTGRTVLVMTNSNATTRAGSIISVADEHGRTADEPYSVAQNAIAFMGPFPPSRWNQAGGICHVDVTVASGLTIGAFELPNE